MPRHKEFTPDPLVHLHIMLADGNRREHFFFDKVLKTLSHHIRLTTVEDGERLMVYLFESAPNLPDVLILDYNMPRKNGFECLTEIKKSEELKELPVIMYSSTIHEDMANLLYENGAHFHLRKSNSSKLKKTLHQIFLQLAENKFVRPPREQFLLLPAETEDAL